MPLTVTEYALVGAVVELSVSLYDSVRIVPAELIDVLLNAGAVKSTVELFVVIARVLNGLICVCGITCRC